MGFILKLKLFRISKSWPSVSVCNNSISFILYCLIISSIVVVSTVIFSVIKSGICFDIWSWFTEDNWDAQNGNLEKSLFGDGIFNSIFPTWLLTALLINIILSIFFLM